jgi:hypothetical protein
MLEPATFVAVSRAVTKSPASAVVRTYVKPVALVRCTQLLGTVEVGVTALGQANQANADCAAGVAVTEPATAVIVEPATASPLMVGSESRTGRVTTLALTADHWVLLEAGLSAVSATVM